MPYQNLDSEIMLALSIWLLAITIFAVMLVLAVVQIISESRAKGAPKRWNHFVHRAVNIFHRMKRN